MDVIWRQIGIKSLCLGFILKPHWLHYTKRGKKEVGISLLLYWNQCGFKMNPTSQLFGCIPGHPFFLGALLCLPLHFLGVRNWSLQLKYGLMVLPVSFFIPGAASIWRRHRARIEQGPPQGWKNIIDLDLRDQYNLIDLNLFWDLGHYLQSFPTHLDLFHFLCVYLWSFLKKFVYQFSTWIVAHAWLFMVED